MTDFTLDLADQVRDRVQDDFAKIMDELEFVKAQLAGPTLKEHLADLEWRLGLAVRDQVGDQVHDGFDKIMDELVSVNTQLARLSKNEHLADLEWRLKSFEDTIKGMKTDLRFLIGATALSLLALSPLGHAILTSMHWDYWNY